VSACKLISLSYGLIDYRSDSGWIRIRRLALIVQIQTKILVCSCHVVATTVLIREESLLLWLNRLQLVSVSLLCQARRFRSALPPTLGRLHIKIEKRFIIENKVTRCLRQSCLIERAATRWTFRLKRTWKCQSVAGWR
jgi:hypothetical protein